ncbi:MAG: DUF6088 family protein [Rhodobacteraceae bacterium]|nr:DUF6088 family protein [Paracoccaceae bacterium]
MRTISEAVKAYAKALPEGATLSARECLHLGERAAIDQALSRLVKRGDLMRIRRGIFVLPIPSRFGKRPPSVAAVVASLARSTGERISINGASAANLLGLSTQNPTRYVYWTSGPDRVLTLGAQRVELKHVPNWKLCASESRAGHAFRALAYIGRVEAGRALRHIRPQLTDDEWLELLSLRANAPLWMAKEFSAFAAAQ